MPLPNSSAPTAESSLIAGSVLPIQRAEELLATLPGVMSARIVASPNGAVDVKETVLEKDLLIPYVMH